MRRILRRDEVAMTDEPLRRAIQHGSGCRPGPPRSSPRSPRP
ncbi:hypothetical protein NKH77_51465 [Streptomyces sp. M19]